MAEHVRKNLLQTIEELRWDVWLAATTIGLVIFGVVMVYSASAAAPKPYKFLISQIAWAVMGLAAMVVLQRIDYHRYAQPRFIFGFLGVCALLLVVVFFFGTVNGAHRWIVIRSLSVSAQPSELAKLSLILFLAWFLAERERHKELDSFMATILPASVVVGLLAVLIVKEPDLGTTLILAMIFGVMLFAVGAPMKHLYKLGAFGLAAGALLIVRVAWRFDRVKVFFNPELDPQGKGYQPLQSLIAVGSGGANGLGLGQGKQKLSFLPAPQSDYIFAVISEELGLTGAISLVLVFGFFLWRGLRAGHRAPDRFGQLIAIGITTAIVTQALFNISVALNLLPSKGITLPFVSAGGSSLFVALAAMGILLNVSEQGVGTGRRGDGATGR